MKVKIESGSKLSIMKIRDILNTPKWLIDNNTCFVCGWPADMCSNDKIIAMQTKSNLILHIHHQCFKSIDVTCETIEDIEKIKYINKELTQGCTYA